MTKTYAIDDTNKERAQATRERSVLYGVEDVPAAHLCFLFGLQQAIMTIGGVISIPFILTNLLCADENVTSELISITMFMCGVATVLQTIVGIRLGIIQGGSHTFVAPIVAMMSIARWKCQTPENVAGGTDSGDQWKERMREIQGNLILASLTQLVLGCTGLMGFFLQFIGPLTIAPTISLIGLSLTSVAADFNKVHWGIAFMSMAVLLISSLYLGGIKVPVPAYSTGKGCHFLRYPVFQLFPVIISISVTWIFCSILTVTDVFPNNSTHLNYGARTDARLHVLHNAPWFYWPYPFQFGVPTVSIAGYVGFLAATLSSIIESIGDYYACARISGAAPPPTHAVNRGIAIEGFCSIISGLVGAGHGTTSYSGNIGAIGITKVASRRVFTVAGVIMIVCGVVGKFGAIFTIIPEPIIGGTLTVVFGMVASVGIATLQFVDMNSLRNLTIVGVSLLLGLMVPQFVNAPENTGIIDTGNDEVNQMLQVLLGTAMFVGGLTGFILDNTVPGSPEERGILSWRQSLVGEDDSRGANLDMYDFPYVTKFIRKLNFCEFIPISPTFNKSITVNCDACRRRGNDTGTSEIDMAADTFAYDNAVTAEEQEIRKSTTARTGGEQTQL